MKLHLQSRALGATASHPTRVRGLKQVDCACRGQRRSVAPHAGAWIETGKKKAYTAFKRVAPHAGAWIETAITTNTAQTTAMSHPTRVRGLKLDIRAHGVGGAHVAPHAGAWIETRTPPSSRPAWLVAPHAGAWIETQFVPVPRAVSLGVAPHAGAWIETPVSTSPGCTALMSHPTRVRGLKPLKTFALATCPHVAPHAGAWIETLRSWLLGSLRVCRTPRGCVD